MQDKNKDTSSEGILGGQSMSFGKNFVWGAATAACQIEGAYKEDGKGLHIHERAHLEGFCVLV